jgi:high-affinity Fe2+/Pb2+ permease
MQELLPVVSGLIIGSLLGLLRPSMRVPVGAALAIAFGVVATIVSGEFRISWAFLLIDIPLVAVSAAVSLFGMHRWRWNREQASGPREHLAS